jgi:hypothetical protein
LTTRCLINTASCNGFLQPISETGSHD